jgi:hypothetical protein
LLSVSGFCEKFVALQLATFATQSAGNGALRLRIEMAGIGAEADLRRCPASVP